MAREGISRTEGKGGQNEPMKSKDGSSHRVGFVKILLTWALFSVAVGAVSTLQLLIVNERVVWEAFIPLPVSLVIGLVIGAIQGVRYADLEWRRDHKTSLLPTLLRYGGVAILICASTLRIGGSPVWLYMAVTAAALFVLYSAWRVGKRQ